MTEYKTTKIRIFVSNLGAYNNGTLTGQWTTLPVDNVKDIYKQDFENYGDVDGYGEEYFITDYEAPFPIDEYEDVEWLNKLAKCLDDDGIEDVKDIYDNLKCKEFMPDEPVPLNDDVINAMLEDYTPAQTISAVYGSDRFNWSDDLVRWDGLGHLETLSNSDWAEEINDHSEELINEYVNENSEWLN